MTSIAVLMREYYVLALCQMQEESYSKVERTSVILLLFRFCCLLPFITVPILIVPSCRCIDLSPPCSPSLLLIYKKASF
jgi:hypothetical protein